jgi:hypothetical protein
LMESGYPCPCIGVKCSGGTQSFALACSITLPETLELLLLRDLVL